MLASIDGGSLALIKRFGCLLGPILAAECLRVKRVLRLHIGGQQRGRLRERSVVKRLVAKRFLCGRPLKHRCADAFDALALNGLSWVLYKLRSEAMRTLLHSHLC